MTRVQDGTVQKSKKGTWTQAIVSLVSPIIFILGVRWIVVEPFQIPSGSMIPSLLIHDHILVQKFAYGLHSLWGQDHLWFWNSPQRGDIVVFRYPKNPDVYYIKRLMGLPGDQIVIKDRQISINGKPLLKKPLNIEDEPYFEYFQEATDQESHTVRYLKADLSDEPQQTFDVPKDSYFFMGDNRDESSDSRVWGFVEQKLLIGKAWVIWLSCTNTLESSPQLCNPSTIRWNRLFIKPGADYLNRMEP